MMLKLSNFKKFEVKTPVNLIKGGISCAQFWQVMAYLDENNPDQADAIRATYEPSGWTGFQCT